MKNKPQVFKAIVTALLGLLVFAVAYFITYLLTGLVIGFLNAIPIIGTMLGWLFEMRGDSPALLTVILSPTIGYITTTLILSAINKRNSTLGLSFIITGSLLIPLHLISMIINLVYGGSILANIAQAIAGIAFIMEGTKVIRRN